MKKTFLFLGAAMMMLAACNKSETVNVPEAQGPVELGFKAFSAKHTKGAELTGSLLPNTYGIYAAATQKNASGVIENPSFFTGNEQLFGTTDTPVATTLWHAGEYATSAFSPKPQYWPIGGVQMDFLAYSMPMASHEGVADGDWKAVWDNATTDVASQVTFYNVNTYDNQEDVLFAAANDMNGSSSAVIAGDAVRGVNLAFDHAQALLIFNVKVKGESAADNDAVSEKMKIKEIAFYTADRVEAMREHEQLLPSNPSHVLADRVNDDITLKTIGTFRVDNSRNNLLASWSDLASDKDQHKMPDGVTAKSDSNLEASIVDDAKVIDYDEPIPYAEKYRQLGETLLIPEQTKVNFTITYEVGGKTMLYTYNDLRGVWEKGKKYIYNLDLTLNEIVITESVNDFVLAQSDIAL